MQNQHTTFNFNNSAPAKNSATKTLIILNVIAFLPWVLSYLTKNSTLYAIEMYYAALNINIPDIPSIQNGAVYQLLTAAFLHASPTHLIFNMYALFIFGKPLEQFWSTKQFLFFYLFVAISANFASVLLFEVSGYPVRLIGASGAVFGLLMAFGAYYPNTTMLLFFIIPIKMKWLLPLFIMVELLLEISSSQSGIAHSTHLFGILFAFIYLLLRYKINPIKKIYFEKY